MLRIIQAKPNPEGEDKYSESLTRPEYQLSGEWIDIKFDGFGIRSLAGLEIKSLASGDPDKESWIKFYDFKDDDIIGAGKVLRIHSGFPVPVEKLPNIDAIGADAHLFTGKGYALCNHARNKIGIWDAKNNKWIDQAHYDEYPEEGAVLERNDGRLVHIEKDNSLF